MAPITIYPTTLDFVGSAWSLWPPHNNRGEMNVVTGTSKIVSNMLSLCLTPRGSRPLHPTYGVAPELFQPLSDYEPQYWVWKLQEALNIWVGGEEVDELIVDTVDYEDYKNRLTTQITFIPKISPTEHCLTFGFYEYRGAVWNEGIEPFLESIALRGESFMGF